jgi:hypothetical protein
MGGRRRTYRHLDCIQMRRCGGEIGGEGLGGRREVEISILGGLVREGLGGQVTRFLDRTVILTCSYASLNVACTLFVQ